MSEEYPRVPTEEEKAILKEHHMNEESWLVIFRNKREMEVISKRSHRRKVIYMNKTVSELEDTEARR